MTKTIKRSGGLSTKYEVNYTKIKGEQKRQEAIADIENYLGKDKWCEIKAALKKDYPCRPPLEQLAFLFMLCGVEGYPVQAVHETLWLSEAKKEK